MTVGEKIRRMRKARRLSIADVATRVGISQSAVSQFERGVLRATPITLLDIAAAMKCNVIDIADVDDMHRLFDLEIKLEQMRVVAPRPEGDAFGFQEEIAKRCKALNRAGLRRVIDYIDDIMQIPGYFKDNIVKGDD